MSAPSTTPYINLSENLSEQTYHAIRKISYEFGIQPDDLGDCKYLCWVIELLKHVRDTPYNFPKGKYATIITLQSLVANSAKEVTKLLYGV